MTFVFSLIGGLLIAIAIQLVFANLGIALGLSVLDWSPAGTAVTEETDDDDVEGGGGEKSDRSLPITHLLGFGVAVGFSGVIFVSTLLSVEFSALIDPRRGIVFGLIFWAAYWLLFVWLSSTTIAGIADSLLDSALSGGKQLISTIKQALEPNEKAAAGSAENTMLEALVAEVSQLSDVQKELPTLLANQREALLAEICDRTNLSSQEAETIINELEPDEPISTPPPTAPVAVSTPASKAFLSQLDLPSWQQILRQALTKVDLSDWDFETLWQQLPDSSAEKVQYLTAQFSESATAVLPQGSGSDDSSPEPVEEFAEEFAEASDFLMPPDSAPSTADLKKVKAIESKLIAYCRYTNVESLTAEKLQEKVQTQREDYDLLTDERLANLTLDFDKIESVLSRRKKLETQKRKQLMTALTSAWPTIVYSTAAQADLSVQMVDDDDTPSLAQPAEDAYQSLEMYFQSIDWSEISLEDIKPEVNLLLEQIERKGTLKSIDWGQLGARVQVPQSLRADFTTWVQTAWLAKVQSLRPALSGSAFSGSEISESAQDISQQLADQITDYLHHQNKADLEPDKIAASLSRIVSRAIATLPHPTELLDVSKLQSLLDVEAWSKRLWNKDRWKQALETRKDLTEEEIHQILVWGEQVWQPKASQVSSWLKVIRAEVGEHLPTDLISGLSLPDLSLSDLGLSDLSLPGSHAVTEPLAEVRQQIAGQIAAAQEKISYQATALKEDLQSQADAARRQVAIAAWWLFIALVTSGSAAAGAGWLAATY